MNSDFRRTVGRFAQAIRACSDLGPRARLVAMAMLDHLDREAFARTGELVTWDGYGVDALARDTASCTRDVERARSAMLRLGLIEPAGARPARGRPARHRFRPDWLAAVAAERSAGAATPDTGVADSAVGRAGQRPTKNAPTPDKNRAQRPTHESPIPCNNLGINLGRAGAREDGAAVGVAVDTAIGAEAEADEDAIAACRGHFTAIEVRSWLSGCRFERSGGTATVWAPTRFEADWLGRNLDRLRAALGVYDVALRVPPPPARPPAGTALRLVPSRGSA